MLHTLRPEVTHRARECRVEAEIEPDPERRRERKETALAYERMADRAERYAASTLPLT